MPKPLKPTELDRKLIYGAMEAATGSKPKVTVDTLSKKPKC